VSDVGELVVGYIFSYIFGYTRTHATFSSPDEVVDVGELVLVAVLHSLFNSRQ
jgi:hypothetical protein